jgi:hypothetical protein
MLALFIDVPLSDKDYRLTLLKKPKRAANPLPKTFRGDQVSMVTQADAWAVIFIFTKIGF